MRPILPLLTAATLLSTLAFAPAQAFEPTPGPLATPAIAAPAPTPAVVSPSNEPAAAPSPTPGKRQRRKKKDAAPVAASPATSAPAATPAAGGASPAPVPAKAAKAERRNAAESKLASMTPAPGGGPGMVWVNTKSNVYHESNSAFYGKTKEGKYMTEDAAKAAGAHAAKAEIGGKATPKP